MLAYPSSELRNKYGEISDKCKESSDPVYITKNGYNDLVILSPQTYERMVKDELYERFRKTFEAMDSGEEYSLDEAFEAVFKDLKI